MLIFRFWHSRISFLSQKKSKNLSIFYYYPKTSLSLNKTFSVLSAWELSIGLLIDDELHYTDYMLILSELLH